MKKLKDTLTISTRKNSNAVTKSENYLVTTDYDLFKHLDFNREIKKEGYREIMESMNTYGFIVPIHALRFPNNPYLWTGDGQHRVTAARILGLPIEFRIHDVKDKVGAIRLIAMLNSTAKAWSSKVFLSVWTNMEIREYVKFSDIQERLGYSVTTMLHAYTGSGKNEEFKKGELKFTNEKKGDVVIEQLLKLDGYLPKKAFCERKLIPFMLRDDWNYRVMKKLIMDFSKNDEFSENQTKFSQQIAHLMKCATSK
jgi:hypothetical protein